MSSRALNYSPGQLILAERGAAYSSSTVALDGSVYNDIWVFMPSPYSDAALTTVLPCRCLVRLDLFLATASVSSTGGIGLVWASNSATNPSQVWDGGLGAGWSGVHAAPRTRATEASTLYGFGEGFLPAGTYVWVPVWRVQSPYYFYARFTLRLQITAWAAP